MESLEMGFSSQILKWWKSKLMGGYKNFQGITTKNSDTEDLINSDTSSVCHPKLYDTPLEVFNGAGILSDSIILQETMYDKNIENMVVQESSFENCPKTSQRKSLTNQRRFEKTQECVREGILVDLKDNNEDCSIPITPSMTKLMYKDFELNVSMKEKAEGNEVSFVINDFDGRRKLNENEMSELVKKMLEIQNSMNVNNNNNKVKTIEINFSVSPYNDSAQSNTHLNSLNVQQNEKSVSKSIRKNSSCGNKNVVSPPCKNSVVSISTENLIPNSDSCSSCMPSFGSHPKSNLALNKKISKFSYKKLEESDYYVSSNIVNKSVPCPEQIVPPNRKQSSDPSVLDNFTLSHSTTISSPALDNNQISNCSSNQKYPNPSVPSTNLSSNIPRILRNRKNSSKKIRRRHSVCATVLPHIADDTEADISADDDNDSDIRTSKQFEHLGISPIRSHNERSSSKIQRQELLQILEANMEKNKACFQRRKPSFRHNQHDHHHHHNHNHNHAIFRYNIDNVEHKVPPSKPQRRYTTNSVMTPKVKLITHRNLKIKQKELEEIHSHFEHINQKSKDQRRIKTDKEFNQQLEQPVLNYQRRDHAEFINQQRKNIYQHKKQKNIKNKTNNKRNHSFHFNKNDFLSIDNNDVDNDFLKENNANNKLVTKINKNYSFNCSSTANDNSSTPNNSNNNIFNIRKKLMNAKLDEKNKTNEVDEPIYDEINLEESKKYLNNDKSNSFCKKNNEVETGVKNVKIDNFKTKTIINRKNARFYKRYNVNDKILHNDKATVCNELSSDSKIVDTISSLSSSSSSAQIKKLKTMDSDNKDPSNPKVKPRDTVRHGNEDNHAESPTSQVYINTKDHHQCCVNVIDHNLCCHNNIKHNQTCCSGSNNSSRHPSNDCKQSSSCHSNECSTTKVFSNECKESHCHDTETTCQDIGCLINQCKQLNYNRQPNFSFHIKNETNQNKKEKNKCSKHYLKHKYRDQDQEIARQQVIKWLDENGDNCHILDFEREDLDNGDVTDEMDDLLIGDDEEDAEDESEDHDRDAIKDRLRNKVRLHKHIHHHFYHFDSMIV